MAKKNERLSNDPSKEELIKDQQHEHSKHEKQCCEECSGQGSCKNMTKISSIPQTSIDIAPSKS